ncbi:YjiH family protein [Jeotgalibacillus terrae]|uniref:YjiH family protein n=1 Tax=Jeotgalibacillus terrae TaxID=587735 RepID=A0ABW5ZG81_9BACL|nr:YjiH family protein [Jeotgalibacillus terrae]MBM7580316.1 nucleoside recognition membrane protein YjiH [Jeotgalibacillus terrae]
MNTFTAKDYLRFIIPSIIGIFLFMMPIPTEEAVTIPIAILSDWLQLLIGSAIPALMTLLIIIAAVVSLTARVAKPDFITNYEFRNNLFMVSWFWVIVRILAAVFAVITLFQLGGSSTELIWSEYTGGLLLGEGGLITLLFSLFLFAGLFLPLLLNFGLLEWFGTLMAKIMRPLFRLPGRASIDSLASWLGDGTIGVMLTNKQYEEGHYSKREAAVIGTTFSIVSITFSIVIIKEVDLEAYFIPFYLTIALAGFIAAIIMPRIPPLSLKKKTYISEAEEEESLEDVPDGKSRIQHGTEMAIEAAKKNNSVSHFFKSGMKNVLDMWLGVAPVVMAFGTIALILAEETSFFVILGTPFVPILELLQLPNAADAAQTMVVGFADMFLPAIIGADIPSEMTRFVIAAVSVTQLIYMSEVGGVLLGSKVPVNFLDLVLIFLLRTIITLPIIAGVAHLLF